jgi:hypothetical protein
MQISITHSAATCGTETIRNFFGDWHLHDALYCFDRLMEAACADKLLFNTIPSNHLFFVNQLKMLGEAASLVLMEELGRQCIEEYLSVANGHRVKIKHSTPAPPNMLMQADKHKRVMDETGAGFDNRERWLNTPLGGNEWHCFPRYLTAEQFENPWLAIEAFVDSFSANARDERLDILLEQALGENNVDQFISASDIMLVQRSWKQLLEGCHLLVVRDFAR